MTSQEIRYCYAQSQQLTMQTGSIGYLRADFDSNGKNFYSTWFDHRKELKSDAFKAEFDDVINALREKKEYGGLLKGRTEMTAYCRKNVLAFEGNYTTEYGVRVDTDHYSYLLRMNPTKGDYNLYCYCYVKQWLDRHLKQAERGIRFITPDYKEKFRIADGDKIRIIRSDGEKNDRVCRYIDETHFELGEGSMGLFHICEFAEKMEAANTQAIIPLRASLPDKCFSYLESTGEMIVINKGEPGYTPTARYGGGVTPREAVDAANKAMGVTRTQEEAMVAGSMFGWHVPGADPKNYNENGDPIRPQRKDRGEAR
jgi:hypothetical protein